MENTNARRQAYEFGKFAEEMATCEYIKKGYVILDRNWRMGKTEIDIIAQKDDTVVMVEVKARNGKNSDPIEAVTRDKRRRMVKAADVYLRLMKGSLNYRFDIFTLTGSTSNYTYEVIEDAFVSPDLL